MIVYLLGADEMEPVRVHIFSADFSSSLLSTVAEGEDISDEHLVAERVAPSQAKGGKGRCPEEHKFSRGKMKSPLQKRGKDRVCIVGGRTGLATGGDIKESIVKLDLFDKRCIENSTSRNRERTSLVI
ncbi:hypothetical protein CDAR_478731 [Caerostris darwini]|uniref:Uncharacterized protein n=1 Tax=Caerostris darwini TaxID=1538125 RepID=A0AAV4X667_9ARAC|nr:hypothetical protein CDAR_478731 [Caerostris darwini]